MAIPVTEIHSRSARLAVMATVTVTLAAGAAGAQSIPDDWRAAADAADPSEIRVVAMEPGWHISPGPDAVIYQPTSTTDTSYRLEYDAFVFPGEPAGFGVFFGGRGLEPDSYDFFEVLLDGEGRFRMGHVAGPDYHEVVPWTPSTAIATPTADGPANNRLVVDVSAARLSVLVNDVELAAFEPPSYARFDGVAGIRVLEGTEVHVTRLERIDTEVGATDG